MKADFRLAQMRAQAPLFSVNHNVVFSVSFAPRLPFLMLAIR